MRRTQEAGGGHGGARGGAGARGRGGAQGPAAARGRVAARVRARHRGGDRAYWDARYRESGAACLFGDRVAPLLRRAARLLPRRGRALDVACGEGQNAVWLAARGLAVTGLDVSPVAIARARARARRRGVRLRARVVDLTRHRLRRGWYDVVTCVHYLDRRLVPALAAALRPGGVVIVENATVRNLRLHARPGRRFTLRVGELAGWFPGLETLAYREGLMDGHEQAQLVARRPRAPRSPRAGRRADARRADARRADARRGGDGRGEGRVRPARRGPG